MQPIRIALISACLLSLVGINSSVLAETIDLYEIAHYLGIRPDVPTLQRVNKGGSFTAKIINPDRSKHVGLVSARRGYSVNVLNLGDNQWEIDQYQTGEKLILIINRAVYPTRKIGLSHKVVSHYMP